MIRSSITADYHGNGEATVLFTPSLLQRLFLRRTRERQAYLQLLPRGDLRWRWSDGSEIEGAVWCVLVDAYREHCAHLAYHAAVGPTSGGAA